MIKAKYHYKSIVGYSLLGILFFLVVFGCSAGVTSAVSTSSTTTVLSATLSPVLFISNNATTTMATIVPTGTGTQCTAFDTLNFYTNSSGGYTLYISSSSSTSASLVSGGNSIPTQSTVAVNTAAPTQNSAGVDKWGYSVNPTQTPTTVNFGSTYPLANGSPLTTATTGTPPCNTITGLSTWQFAGMPLYTAPQPISTSTDPVASTYTTVFYGLYVDSAKASGTYQTTIVYTMVTSP